MSLFKFFQLLQYSSLLSAMRSSPWVFPVIASIHLMGLALIGGAVLLVDLRLLGLGMRNQPLPQIARYAALFLALVFTFAVRRKLVMAAETPMSPLQSKLVATVSLALWGTVAIAGRVIGLP